VRNGLEQQAQNEPASEGVRHHLPGHP
jgi:hypothetical protein